MSLSKSQRAALYAMFDGCCAYCGGKLPERGWHADHIEAIWRDVQHIWNRDKRQYDRKLLGCRAPENERTDNYYPSCRACNINKSAMSIEDWRESLAQSIRILRDNHAVYRHAERFGLVTVMEPIKVTVHFERIEGRK